MLAAWGARLLLAPLFGERVPFITFFPAVFAVAWWGGFRPTLFATLLSVPVLVYFILEPKYSFAIDSAGIPRRPGIYSSSSPWPPAGSANSCTSRAGQAQQASDQAIAERERLRVTLASIGDGVIVTDERGQIVSLNAVAESLTGWKQEQARGKPLEQVFRIVNEDTRQAVEDPCAQSAAHGHSRRSGESYAADRQRRQRAAHRRQRRADLGRRRARFAAWSSCFATSAKSAQAEKALAPQPARAGRFLRECRACRCIPSDPTESFCAPTRPSSTCSATAARNTSAGTSPSFTSTST